MRALRVTVVDGYEGKRDGTEEKEGRRGREIKKVKDTNKRQIDIKETTCGDDACRHGVRNSHARFPFPENKREVGEN